MKANVLKYIERKLTDYLSKQDAIKFDVYNKEPRVVGDFIQTLIQENFGELFFDIIKTYKSNFTRKAMEDIAYYDSANNYFAIDIKTHRLNDSQFNMPNLVSVKVLNEFYRESSLNHFMILKVDYTTSGKGIKVERVRFIPIEHLSWGCLGVGALGWGQVQIKNANKILIKKLSKSEWMVNLCSQALTHYEKEIIKIKEERSNYFTESLDFWNSYDPKKP